MDIEFFEFYPTFMLESNLLKFASDESEHQCRVVFWVSMSSPALAMCSRCENTCTLAFSILASSSNAFLRSPAW